MPFQLVCSGCQKHLAVPVATSFQLVSIPASEKLTSWKLVAT